PREVVDRSSKEEWISKGRKTIGQRAKERADELLDKYPGVSLEQDILKNLTEIMKYKDIDFKSFLEP
ncbi:MAG: trimethylamine methyltransferase family protein, partial [Candidatus Heimdallarchaeota archaeon]